MAKRNRRERDRIQVATGTVSRVTVPSLSSLEPLTLPLIEDRRTFHPDRVRPAARFTTGGPSRLGLSERKNTRGRFKGFKANSQTKAPIAFDVPASVAVCVRRKTRKQVLFAQRKTGRAGTKRLRRTRRRSSYSSVRC